MKALDGYILMASLKFIFKLSEIPDSVLYFYIDFWFCPVVILYVMGK